MKVEVCQRGKKTDIEGMLPNKNKAPEPGTERARMRAVTRELCDAERERGGKKIK